MLTREVDCTIARRLLVNYRVDPDVVAAQLPAPFRPQTVSGWGVGGVCFIALRDLRSRPLGGRVLHHRTEHPGAPTAI
jgi:hypothetical protein